MTAMQNRARALENQFAYDQEMQFKAEVRRNVMVGRWAADVIGRTDAESYAREYAMVAVNEPHRLLERLRQDFADAGVSVGEDEISTRMGTLLRQAAEELAA